MLKKAKKSKICVKQDSINMWQEDETLLCKNKICKFNVNYLGTLEIKEPKNEILCNEAMVNLLVKKRKTGELKICSYSITFQDRSVNILLLDQTLKKVVRCSTYSIVPHSFFYVGEDSTKETFQFYGFVSCKETSERIVNAIEYAMDLYNERQIKSIQLQKSDDSNQNVTQTIFKQATLTEKFQDPQSSIVSNHIPITCSKTCTDLKSIPRPKGSFERKASFDNFPKLFQEDMFKTANVPSKSIDSSMKTLITQFQIDGSDSTDMTWCNFSSEEKLQQIHNVNEAFHNKKLNKLMPQTFVKYDNETSHKGNESDQKTKYDSLKNLNTQVASGWSEDLVKSEEGKTTAIKSFNNFVDEMIIKDIFNINHFRNQEQSIIFSKK